MAKPTNENIENDGASMDDQTSTAPAGKILTKSNKTGRSILVDEPEILRAGSISEIVDCLVRNGKDMDTAKAEALVFKKVKDQLIVDLRSNVRNMLESKTKEEGSEEEVLRYTDEAILANDWPKWTPAIRQTQDDATKLAKFLGPDADLTKLAQAISQQKGIPFEDALSQLKTLQGLVNG